MAPNLKKLSLLHDDSFADASAFLAVVKGHGRRGVEGEGQRPHRFAPQHRVAQEVQPTAGVVSTSYWDWPAASDPPSPPVDLFSADRLQSNLLRASAEAASAANPPTVVAATASDSNDEEYYWAERDQRDGEVDVPSAGGTVPQHHNHHPLNVPVSSDDYWRDARGERLESDSYWTHHSDLDKKKVVAAGADPVRVFARDDEGLRRASDRYWDESSRHALGKSDAYWNWGPTAAASAGAAPYSSEYAAVVARGSPLGRRRLEASWLWSHERTESDHYWNWESPAAASTSPPPPVLAC